MLNSSLLETKKELEKFEEFDVKFYGEERFPSQGQSGEWRTMGLRNIEEIIEILNQYSGYFSNQFCDEIKIRLDEIIHIYDQIIGLIVMEDFERFSFHFEQIKSAIQSVLEILKRPEIKDINESDFKEKDYFSLCPYLITINNLFTLNEIIELVSIENNLELKFKIIRELIDFNNLESEQQTLKVNQIPTKLSVIYKESIEADLKRKKEDLRIDISNVEKMKLQTIEEIERAKNSLIITAFKDKSDSSKDYINILYCLISFLFLVIIASLFFRLNIKPDEKFHLLPFLYFVSYITAISSFLAFLIKEKNRLIAQSDYFNRCHVELSALPTYVYDLEKSKIENLKIDLAHKYFTGGSNSNNNNDQNQELNISNENIKQMLEIIKEVSKK